MPSTAPIVYETVASPSRARGTLFAKCKFWISARCPSRQHFVDIVKGNGGTVVMSEKMADYCIVDHMRKDIMPGGISYKFLEQSIRDGRLADPEEHVTGPARGELRDIGSLRPTKGSRTAYSAEDDRILYEWVKPLADKGLPVSGNVIYKDLEKEHPQHTWQSWRDRYVKILQFKRPSTVVAANPPPSPPVEPPSHDEDAQPQATSVGAQKATKVRDSNEAHDLGQLDGAEEVAADTAEEQVQEEEPTNINSTSVNKSARTNGSLAQKENLAGMTSRMTQGTEVRVHKAARKSAPSRSPRAVPPAPEDPWYMVFGKHDYMELYTNVKHIRSCTMDEYEDGWDKWAEGTPASGVEWRTFFEKKVLLDWKAHGVDDTRKEKHKRYVAELESAEESQGEPSRAIESQFSQPKVRFQIDDDENGQEDPAESPSTPTRKRTRADVGEEETPDTAKRSKVDEDESDEVAPDGSTAVVVEISDAGSSSDEEIDAEPPSQVVEIEDLNAASQNEIPESASRAAENADSSFAMTNEDGTTQEPGSSQLPDIDMEVPEPLEDDDDHEGSVVSLLPNPPSDVWQDEPQPEMPASSTENTPRANRYNTQAILETPTQDIDLDMPLPPSDSEAEDEDEDADMNGNLSRNQRAASILSTTSTTSASSTSSAPLTGGEVASLYREFTVRGFHPDTITSILLATSNYHKLSEAVANEFEAGRGLPQDWRGVWTARDDEDLDSADARASVRLEEKHGSGRVEERREFVRCLRRGGWVRRGGEWVLPEGE